MRQNHFGAVKTQPREARAPVEGAERDWPTPGQMLFEIGLAIAGFLCVALAAQVLEMAIEHCR